MTKKKIGIVFFLILALCLVAFYIICDQLYLEVQLRGNSQQTIIYGESFSDPGADVLLRGRFCFRKGIPLRSAEVTVSGAVDAETVGRYDLLYEAEYMGFRGSDCRYITVVDTEAPVIFLNDWTEDALSAGDFAEPGFSAQDNYDGDITHKVIRKETDGMITYAVTDSSGNPAYTVREIPEYDPPTPKIQLNGEYICKLKVGIPYEEPGYTACDDADGDLTHLVAVEGAVDFLHPGEYPLVYTVADSDGNETREVRTVIVETVPQPDTVWPEDKTIYLTFDDGPGPYTMQLLDILDCYRIKATFFVVNTEDADVIQEIVIRGHSIGIHSVNHDYEQIYASPQAFFADLYEMQQIIYEKTGVVTSLMRFPGGGSNLVSKRFAKGIMSDLTQAVQDAGFQYFDWNVDSDDAGNAKRKKEVLDNVIKGIEEAAGVAMVLQHDVHPYSVEAVEEIIQWGLNNGYTFRAIRNSTPGFHHDVLN